MVEYKLSYTTQAKQEQLAIREQMRQEAEKKKDFTSLPYSKIQAFSVETSGHFDLDSELELYFSGLGKVKLEFTGASDIVQIGQLIGTFVL